MTSRAHATPAPERVPDPLAEAERDMITGPLRLSFELITGGRDPRLDACSIISEVLEGLTPEQRPAVLSYITSRFSGYV